MRRILKAEGLTTSKITPKIYVFSGIIPIRNMKNKYKCTRTRSYYILCTYIIYVFTFCQVILWPSSGHRWKIHRERRERHSHFIFNLSAKIKHTDSFRMQHQPIISPDENSCSNDRYCPHLRRHIRMRIEIEICSSSQTLPEFRAHAAFYARGISMCGSDEKNHHQQQQQQWYSRCNKKQKVT